jgi:hypothetical protein
MLGFIARIAMGTTKLAVKYVVVPALVSVAIAVAAEALAKRIRAHTPGPDHNGVFEVDGLMNA